MFGKSRLWQLLKHDYASATANMWRIESKLFYLADFPIFSKAGFGQAKFFLLRPSAMKLLLACTSGGHFSTMRALESFWTQHDRVWLTDFKQDTNAISDLEEICWLPYQGPRDGVTFMRNLPQILQIVARQKPDIIVSTGASIAVSAAIIARILGVKFIFVESLTRSKNLSLSGKIVYYLSDEFYVQWPNLCEKYPKAKFEGITV